MDPGLNNKSEITNLFFKDEKNKIFKSQEINGVSLYFLLNFDDRKFYLYRLVIEDGFIAEKQLTDDHGKMFVDLENAIQNEEIEIQSFQALIQNLE